MEAHNATTEDMTNAELAEKCRDALCGSDADDYLVTDKHMASKSIGIFGDHLAHLNHVAMDDERGQELDSSLIESMVEAFSDGNMRTPNGVGAVFPLDEAKELLSRSQTEDEDTEGFDFESLTAGDRVSVTVEAINGELMKDETWTDELKFVEEQNLSAQSRKESFTFKHVNNGQSVHIRYSAKHKNNFGFVKSQEDKSDVDYVAMWQDIMDDREWKVKGIVRCE